MKTGLSHLIAPLLPGIFPFAQHDGDPLPTVEQPAGDGSQLINELEG